MRILPQLGNGIKNVVTVSVVYDISRICVYHVFQEVYDDSTSAWKENKECCDSFCCL